MRPYLSPAVDHVTDFLNEIVLKCELRKKLKWEESQSDERVESLGHSNWGNLFYQSSHPSLSCFINFNLFYPSSHPSLACFINLNRKVTLSSLQEDNYLDCESLESLLGSQSHVVFANLEISRKRTPPLLPRLELTFICCQQRCRSRTLLHEPTV